MQSIVSVSVQLIFHIAVKKRQNLTFDRLPPSVYIFYGVKVYKKSIFLTTYPPPLLNVVCERPLSGISCYMTIYWPPNIRHCDCTMKYWFIKKEWHSLQKNCQENQKNIHWNSVTTSGYGPTDATAELTWPSTTPQWGQNLSEVGFELIFSYFFAFLSWYFIMMFLQVEPKMNQKISIF